MRKGSLWAVGGLVSAVVVAGGCGSSGSGTGGTAGTGGASGTGGTHGAGGASGSGGTHGAGGAHGSGGSHGAGDSGGGGAGGTHGSDGGAGPDWSCVGKVTLPPAAGATGTYTATFSDGLTKAGVPGINVKSCAKADTTCATPVATGTTDSKGMVTLSALPLGTNGFDGYLDVSGGGIIPTLLFRSTPIPQTTGTYAFPVLTSAELAAAGSALGVTTIDPTRGEVAAAVLDCAGKAASGATLAASTADTSSSTFYYAGGLPSATAKVTDSSGAVAILNVPAGDTVMTATVQSTSAVSATFTVPVRAGTITEVFLPPTP